MKLTVSFYQFSLLLHIHILPVTIKVTMDPSALPIWLFYIISVWMILWQGIVLWRSAKLHQRNWFIFFMIIHTGGILELVYLFYFAKKRLTIAEVKIWIRNMFFVKVK